MLFGVDEINSLVDLTVDDLAEDKNASTEVGLKVALGIFISVPYLYI